MPHGRSAVDGMPHGKAGSWTPCTVAGCDRLARAKGLCDRHYQQARHASDLDGARVDRSEEGLLAQITWEPGSVVCGVEGCTRPARSRHLCGRHYTRWHRTGSVGPPGPLPMGPRPEHCVGPRGCSAPGCRRTATARDLCHAHYQRWQKTGDPLAPGPLSSDQWHGPRCGRAGCNRTAIGNDRCSRHQVGSVDVGASPVVRPAVLLRDARRVAARLDALRRSIEADGKPMVRTLPSSVAAVDRLVRRLAERHAAQRRELRRAMRAAATDGMLSS